MISLFRDMKDVFSLFGNKYAIFPAFTDQQKAEAYRVRYNIYCKELGFESGNEDELESDIYDKISTQILLQFKPLDMPVGCVRVVHGRSKSGCRQLPMEAVCGHRLNKNLLQEIKDSGHNYVEISRLGIDKDFRHMGRTGQSGLRTPVRGSCALIALFLGIQAYARVSDTKYLMAIVERRLLNNMKKIGIPIVLMGEGVEHRGTRFPILMDREKIEKIVPYLLRPLYYRIQKDIKKSAQGYFKDLNIQNLDDMEHFPFSTLLTSEFNTDWRHKKGNARL